MKPSSINLLPSTPTTTTSSRRSLTNAWASRPVIILVAATLVVISQGTNVRAAIIHIPSNQPSIQAGIDSATNGDTVLVSEGIYRENIDFRGKAITVSSESGPGKTVIDGQRLASVVSFNSGEGRNSWLVGFTLLNGQGGIQIISASPSIIGNIITNNATCEGSGISIRFGSPLIQDNVIAGNYQSGCSGGIGGGGVSVGGAAAAELVHNIITNNSTGSEGGGISLFAAGTPIIRANLVAGNYSYSGGAGISMVNQSDATITGNLIVGNNGGKGDVYWGVPSGARGPYFVNNTVVGSVFADGYDRNALLMNNILGGLYIGNFNDTNQPMIFNNDILGFGGLGPNPIGSNSNISVDPLFVCTMKQEFRIGPNSPCLDAGNNSATNYTTTDFDGNPRLVDGDQNGFALVDIGAFEYDPANPINPCLFVSCPTEVTVRAAPGQTSVVVNYPAPTASPGATVTSQPPSGSIFPAGTNTVTCTATLGTNSVSCTFAVTVLVPPANDDFDFATLLSNLPYTNTQDTTLATPSADDPNCADPGASVWYKFTTPEDLEIQVDTSGSDYTVSLSAFTGTRGNLTQLDCNYDQLDFTLPAGQPCYLMASSIYGSPGGNLHLHVIGLPAFKVVVSVDPVGFFDPKTRAAKLRGKVTTTRPANVDLIGTLRQTFGRSRSINGDFTVSLTSPGEAPWQAVVPGDKGSFGGGGAEVSLSAVAYDPITGKYTQAIASETVKLRGSPQ